MGVWRSNSNDVFIGAVIGDHVLFKNIVDKPGVNVVFVVACRCEEQLGTRQIWFATDGQQWSRVQRGECGELIPITYDVIDEIKSTITEAINDYIRKMEQK